MVMNYHGQLVMELVDMLTILLQVELHRLFMDI